MDQKSDAALAKQTSTEPQWSDEPWNHVKTAIVERWPHLDGRDVEVLPRDVFQIEKFLNEFTETSPDEIQAVVREYATAPTILHRASHLTEQVSGYVGRPAQSALERVQYEADEHRGSVAGLIFITGVAVGALVTASYFQRQQKTTGLQSYLPKLW